MAGGRLVMDDVESDVVNGLDRDIDFPHLVNSVHQRIFVAKSERCCCCGGFRHDCCVLVA